MRTKKAKKAKKALPSQASPRATEAHQANAARKAEPKTTVEAKTELPDLTPKPGVAANQGDPHDKKPLPPTASPTAVAAVARARARRTSR